MDMQEFRNDLIESIYLGMYQRLEDNFDFARFSYDGVDRSGLINPVQNAKYLEFVLDNIEAFYAASQLFADQESQGLFLKLIKYRCLGHPHIRIRDDWTWSSTKAMIERAASYVERPSKIDFKGFLGGLQHHTNVPLNGSLVNIDAWSVNVAYCLGSGDRRQYYFQRGDISIKPDFGDIVIDGGACFGDTSILFSSSIGENGRVYAFEPLPLHQEVIRFNAAQNGLVDRIHIIPAGIGETTNNVRTIADTLARVASPGFSMLNCEGQIPILSIDDLVKIQGIRSIDFIKLDVEGFELNALKGAKETLEKFKPKLAISLYHKYEDFFEIPLYLKKNYPFYRFYLDHYTIFMEESVLYAMAD